MQYRTFGKDKRKVSVLGFGCMRLPTDNGRMDGIVDEKESERIVRYGIDHGINYVDTAKLYLAGKSEAILGRILQGGYREKVSVATKLPTWEVQTIQDADRIFDEQRRDLKTEKIDVYLIHNIQRKFKDNIEKLRLVDWAWNKKEKGEIDYVGFSFHDDFGFFEETLDYFDRWDFCQLQYNYLGEAVQAGTQGVKLAAQKGLSVVVMEPLLGGTLAKPVGKMGQLFAAEGLQYNPVDLALRWLWNRPEISVVLSGMSAFDHVKQNIDVAERGIVGNLTEQEQAFLEKVQKVYDESLPIKCTKCEYCKKECPMGIDIPYNFECFNNHESSKAIDKNGLAERSIFQMMYTTMNWVQRADQCTKCGKCERVCPQNLAIRELLASTHKTLG